MGHHGRALLATGLLLWIAGAGCTTLREIPRGEYAAVGERRNVRLVTRDGLRYELDFVRFEADTLAGFRRREQEGPIEEFGTVRVPLEDVASLSTRDPDWLRSGLIGGAAILGLAVVGLTRGGDGGPDSSFPGKPPGGGIP
jgi:hypothetical protein